MQQHRKLGDRRGGVSRQGKLDILGRIGCIVGLIIGVGQIGIKRAHQIVAAYGQGDEPGVFQGRLVRSLQSLQSIPYILGGGAVLSQVQNRQAGLIRQLSDKGRFPLRQAVAGGDTVSQGHIVIGRTLGKCCCRQQAHGKAQAYQQRQKSFLHIASSSFSAYDATIAQKRQTVQRGSGR